MSSLRTEERLELQHDLSQMGSQGRAEGEPVEKLSGTFYPVKEHLRMLDPEVVLVVGPRGSGKSEIFRVLTETGLLDAVVAQAGGRSLPSPEKMEWRKAYPAGHGVFDANGLRRFLALGNGSSQPIQDLWFAYLVRLVCDPDDGSQDLQALHNARGGSISEVHGAWAAAGDAPLLALDDLDERLERQDRYLFVAYDELDTLGGSDWEAMAAGISGLVAFWAAYARRWRRIRPKVFLRTDLFDRFAVSGGADLAKLAAGRVDLAWSDRQLYAMLLRRVASTSSKLSQYLRDIKTNVEWQDVPKLGFLPTLKRWTDARPLIERMVGPYMGSNKKKGLSHRWPLAHVRDGRGRAVPRPLVRLFEEAARFETDGPNAVGGMRILHPSSLRRALDRVSSEHVDHAHDEWHWMEALRGRLDGHLVPIERRQMEKLLNEDDRQVGSPPVTPFTDTRDFVTYLVEVGILRQRPDGRIDAPDLFLHGLGLKRKGGVQRR